MGVRGLGTWPLHEEALCYDDRRVPGGASPSRQGAAAADGPVVQISSGEQGGLGFTEPHCAASLPMGHRPVAEIPNVICTRLEVVCATVLYLAAAGGVACKPRSSKFSTIPIILQS